MKSGNVKLQNLVDTMKLIQLTNVSYENIEITSPDVNRPALQLTGFFEYFDVDRVQIIGNVENAYLMLQSSEYKENLYKHLLSLPIPCFIFCRGIQPEERFIEIAQENHIPVFSTQKHTSSFTSEIIKWLHVELSPVIVIHGCLVDIYGVGVLIQGESGIGKSEATIELIKRGHRLVADDAVEIHKVSDITLFGTAPAITKHFVELRGIGIIDVKTLFGVQSFNETKTIELVVNLEEWDRTKDYDRLGENEDYIEFLGNKLVQYSIPLRPGRNLAVILEAAAVNYRQRTLEYNAPKQFLQRVQQQFK